MGSDAFQLRLASHWPCITGIVVLHLQAQDLEEGDERPHAVLWSMVDFTFTLSYYSRRICWLTLVLHKQHRCWSW